MAIFPEIKPISLIKWTERGLIKPVYEPRSSGGKRLYSYKNLIQIGLVNELTLYGMLTPWIKEYLTKPQMAENFEFHWDFTGVIFDFTGAPYMHVDPPQDGKNLGRKQIVEIYQLRPGEKGVFIPLEGTLSRLVVNIGEIQRRIDTILHEFGWR